MRKDKIEAYCIAQIKKHILNHDKISEISQEVARLAGENPDGAKAELKSCRARRTNVAGYIKDLMRKEIEEGVSGDIVQEMKSEYNSELFDLDMRILQLESTISNAISADAVAEYLNEMLENVDTMDDEIKKSIFDQLIEKIVVEDDKVTVYLIVSPFAAYGDKADSGHPHTSLSPSISREAFNELY